MILLRQISQNNENISFGNCSDRIFRLVSVSVHNIVHVVSNNTPGNVKSLIKVLQHALFCHVCNRGLCIISVEAEMAEE